MARTVGLCDLHIAKITKNIVGEYTTDTPIMLARGISAKVSEKWNVAKNYSDDRLEGVARNFDSVEIELDVDRLTNEKRAVIYGQLYKNGFLTASAEDQAPEFALGWRNRLDDGRYQFVWYYCVQAESGASDDFETMAEKIKAGSNKFKLVGKAREKTDIVDGKSVHNYMIKVNEDELLEDENDAKTAISNWFSKVQERVVA